MAAHPAVLYLLEEVRTMQRHLVEIPESGLKCALYPLARCFHEFRQTIPALFLARRLIRGSIALEANGLFVHDDVDVFGEPLDEPPCL